MPTTPDQPTGDRISEARIAQYLRTAMEFLAERGGSARKSEVIEALRSRLSLSKHELALNESGVERWHTWFVFQTIFFQKAGYFTRGGGTWRLLDAGREALATMSAQEMFDVAREKYAEWKRTRPGEDEADDGDDEESPGHVGIGSPTAPPRRTWLIGTGREGELWERFRSDGEIRIGFTTDGEQVGNLGTMTKDEIYARVRALTGDSKPYHTQLACWEFAHEMREGDLVIARAGVRRVLGVGRIIGPYRFDAQAPEYPHSRSVRWFWTKERRLPERVFLHTKTLTDHTRFGDLVDVMLGHRTQAAVDLLGSHKYDSEEIDRFFSAEPVLMDDEPPMPESRPSKGARPTLFSEAFKGKFPKGEDLNDMVRELERKRAIILQGPPGTGKTYIASQLANHFAGDPARVVRVQFHPAYSYEDFIRGIRPNESHFTTVDGPLLEIARRALADPARHVLLIDEFNRGNVARILGEALSLVEGDKRHPSHAVRIALPGRPLPGGDDRSIWLPPNLYLIATMNTADRSIALVDHALRRRFAFIDLEPAFEDPAFEAWLIDEFRPDDSERDTASIAGVKRVVSRLAEAMRLINRRIAAERTLGPGHCLGHSFFCGESGSRDIADWAESVFDREIKPQLREYCADHPKLLAELLGLVPSFAP
jgi:5-methylcytosine-specific restriction protein B